MRSIPLRPCAVLRVQAVRVGLVALLGLGALQVSAQKPPQLQEFSWRGSLVLPEAGNPLHGQGVSVVRLDIPAAGLAHLQGSQAQDVRVFNLAGEAVPLVRLGAPATTSPTPVRTARLAAYPLFAPNAKTAVRNAVEVQLDESVGSTRAWVRWESGGSAQGKADAASPLPAVLLDLRQQAQPLQALELDVQLPPNTLVPVTVAVSPDLKTWTTVDTTGPLYRFDGADAPASTMLTFKSALHVKDRYLRLGWAAQGVQVRGAVGVVAQDTPAATRVRLPLSAGTLNERESQTWTWSFATPIQALVLSSRDDATMLPVRIQGRNDAAEPWHTLGSGVVYRITQGTEVRNNGAFALGGASVRQLRVQALSGQLLPTKGLQAALEFDPVRMAFLTQGQGPFTLAVGRAATPPAWGDAAVLAGAVGQALDDLPAAKVASAVIAQAALDVPVSGAVAQWLPAGVTLRTALLWLVLGLGVLILGTVAMALLRHLGAAKTQDPTVSVK